MESCRESGNHEVILFWDRGVGAGTEGCDFPWSLTGCKVTLKLCHSSKIYLILTRLLFPRTSPQMFSAVFPATITVCFLLALF